MRLADGPLYILVNRQIVVRKRVGELPDRVPVWRREELVESEVLTAFAV